jgi:hypothetical protein
MPNDKKIKGLEPDMMLHMSHGSKMNVEGGGDNS